ncbi:MAG: bifunctional DNA primase/polymerase, partial [Dehalococcoidia bacterium]|nr:bifunctional DNA primase/polymerase [Dehalococcoidia bacterium]
MSIPQIEAVRQAAWAAHRAGLCVVPPKEDGSKAPLGEWKEYQAARPTESELDQWYADSRQGVGLITGKISGNVELFEFDAVSEAYDPFVKLARAAGLGDVIERIETGYLETSPSGGIHWLYRCAEITGNTKLAERPKRPREKKHPKDNSQVLIETRGERGYAIVAPSFGRVHESGNPYELLHGAFDTIATITPEERTALWELARTFDQMPRKERPKERARRQEETRAGGRPGDDFNARTTWPEVIEAHGWERVYERGEIGYWRRPGKERDLSATTGFGGDWLYCFSTSTEFEAQQTYTKFAAYALLNHGGDYAAAARELAKRGFGSARHDAAQAQQEGDSEHYTDLGLARRLVALHGQDMRYCWPWAKWLCWNCQRWETDDSGQVIAWCQETVKAIYADAQIAFAAATEAASQGDKNAASAAKQKGDAIWRWAEKSEATARVNAAIEAARALPGMPVAPEELDADPWV